MTGDQGPREVSEAEIEAAVGAAFGRSSSGLARGAVLQAFTEAGFSEDLAERGADLLESGQFFGFEDVATTLALSPSTFAGRALVTSGRIAEAAGRLERRTGSSDPGAGQSTPVAESKPSGGASPTFAEQLRAEPRSRW